jgi:hypothetical protein
LFSSVDFFVQLLNFSLKYARDPGGRLKHIPATSPADAMKIQIVRVMIKNSAERMKSFANGCGIVVKPA